MGGIDCFIFYLDGNKAVLFLIFSILSARCPNRAGPFKAPLADPFELNRLNIFYQLSFFISSATEVFP